jgi:hypothetical protein
MCDKSYPLATLQTKHQLEVLATKGKAFCRHASATTGSPVQSKVEPVRVGRIGTVLPD